MNASLHQPRHNRLLAMLEADDYERLLGYLDVVALRTGATVCDAGRSLDYVYFPINCIVSMLYVMENGSTAEVAAAGNEGMIGVAVVMGGETATSRIVARSSGLACRLRASVVKREFELNARFRDAVLRYTRALLTQMAQAAVCNRHHTTDQQLSRWLLVGLDSSSSNRLSVTQAQIADMLGVRRESVVGAANRLQEDGLIHHIRGQITVLDRPRLEARVCECYGIVRREIDRLFSVRAAQVQDVARTDSRA